MTTPAMTTSTLREAQRAEYQKENNKCKFAHK